MSNEIQYDTYMEQYAHDLVEAYKTFRDHETRMTDEELSFFMYERTHEKRWDGYGFGNAPMVRQVRRWIDHQEVGLFGQYWFGPRKIGAGRDISAMTWYRSELSDNALMNHVWQATLQCVQFKGYKASAHNREAAIFEALSQMWFKRNMYRHAMACQHARQNILERGELTAETHQELLSLKLEFGS